MQRDCCKACPTNQPLQVDGTIVPEKICPGYVHQWNLEEKGVTLSWWTKHCLDYALSWCTTYKDVQSKCSRNIEDYGYSTFSQVNIQQLWQKTTMCPWEYSYPCMVEILFFLSGLWISNLPRVILLETPAKEKQKGFVRMMFMVEGTHPNPPNMYCIIPSQSEINYYFVTSK